jgi:DNA-binding ferritin-like protein (Dps family)
MNKGKQVMNYFKTIHDQKREYWEYQDRLEKLPNEYQILYREIMIYTWNHGSVEKDGMDLQRMLYGVVELFEEAAAGGKRVLEITGDNITEFCNGLIRDCNNSAYLEKMRKKLDEKIFKKIGGLEK